MYIFFSAFRLTHPESRVSFDICLNGCLSLLNLALEGFVQIFWGFYSLAGLEITGGHKV